MTDMKDKSVYLVRQIGTTNYEVAKFTGDIMPDVLYDVAFDADGARAWCSCPGFRNVGYVPLSDPKAHEHKHVRLVAEFILLGRPWMCAFWFDRNNEVVHRQFGLTVEQFKETLPSA